MRGLLSHRDFRLLLLGQSASTVGDRIVFVALALYVTDIGTPRDVGTIGGALIGFRWRPRHPMRAGMLLALPLPIALGCFGLGVPVELLLAVEVLSVGSLIALAALVGALLFRDVRYLRRLERVRA
jgi:hypothetical protein